MGHLRHVLLLHRYHHCYKLTEIRIGHYQDKQNHEAYVADFTAKPDGFSYKAPPHTIEGRAQIDVTVAFSAAVFGTFAQCLLFDFGRKPHLVQRLNVDVCGKDISDRLKAIRNEVGEQHQKWDEDTIQVVRFVSTATAMLQGDKVRKRYSLPKGVHNIVSAQVITGEPEKGHYKRNMHQLLFTEETFMNQKIGRYCLQGASLHAQRSVFDEIAGMRWATDGELYGILRLDLPITPDDTAGRLFIRNVCAVWLKAAVTEATPTKRVHEAKVEKVEHDSVILKLSARTCSDLQLYDTCDSHVEAQFQINREPLCQMHAAIDNLGAGQLRLLFPDPAYHTARPEFAIRCTWLLKGLNDQQKEIIKAIVSPGRTSAPLVVFGPFGTGKTFVLSQAVRQLVQDRSNRVLLCTHSNKAADIHVELLDDYLERENGILAAKPLRVYQPMRKFEATSQKARKYCLLNNSEFVLPTRQDVIKHHVVITTLVTSRVLLNLQLHHGIFTHILVDEAAQALEPEAIIPLALAGPNTKIVLTGDHMQMCPEVYSPYAKEWGLQRSLPERLFDHYEATQDEAFKNSNVMFLTENYRSHEDILKFPSENFYGGQLVARGHADQLAHPRLGPMVFYTARGIEQRDQDHSFVNLSEVYEVVKRVEEVAGDWPTEWGVMDLSQIAVLSAYKFQVQAIRNQFRRRNMIFRDVTVDTIHNVQGQEFRAVFISTVRTLNTCKKNSETPPESGDTSYLEFLSDPKLLNTAVTRARSLVAVVGDPISLCTVGDCRGIWRDYIRRCNAGGSLHGTTTHELDKEINESVKIIPLNPDAVPFMPQSAETQEQEQPTEESSAKIEEDFEQQILQLEGNEGSKDDETKEVKTGDTSEKGSDSSSDEDGDDDLESLSYEDFQGEILEDATVFPRYMDEIIKALIYKCEETRTKDSMRKSMLPESEFPSLRQANVISKVKQPQHPTFEPRATGVSELAERCPGDYDMVTINGRVEIRLVNLGFQQTPSVQARRLLVSTRPQECLQPEVLHQLLHDDPERYLACTLRLNPEKGRLAFAEIQDTSTPDIEITGRVRQAFDKDMVVIELIPGKDKIQGKIIGTLEHIISPHERQYVCTVDYDNISLLRPLNKSVTKMVNLSDRDCQDMPVYKRERNKHVTKVDMFKRKKVLSGEYLFVVQYLQWRPDCTHPLGIVVKPLPIGNKAQDSLDIAYAEHGVRTSFRGAEKEVRKRFPPSWTVPANEYDSREKVATAAFTIDPPESRDLDDALSVESTPNSLYRVGIHIADVSYFVQPGSALDQEADQRCTSYYPGHGQESIPMLPRQLSEAHCSLLPHQDRLAVSLFLCLNNEGDVVGQPDVRRTIVNSCCRLTYSQAQTIIDQQNVDGKVPRDVVTGVRILNTIAQNKRRTRLGDGADVGHGGDVKEDFEAHELVQEMMILANKTIAEYLVSAIPNVAPLRTQLPPKKHRMTEWLQKQSKYLEYLHATHRCMNVVMPDPEPAAKILKIHQSAWSDICKAAEEQDMVKLTRLLNDEKSQPQLSTAHAQFRRMQARARYVCAGDQPQENNIHYSLGVPNYTHFTSPIRRYADILVHRLVLEVLVGKNVDDRVSREEIARICRRCTFYQANAKKFEKTCRKIHLAKQLKNANQEMCPIVESIEEGRLNLHIAVSEHDLLGGREKQLKISLLNPIDQSHPEGEDAQCIELKFRFRMYYAPREVATSRKKPPDCKEAENAGQIPSSEVEAMLSDDLTHAYDPVDIPGEKWLEMLEAVKCGDAPQLNTLIKSLVRYPRTARSARTDLHVRHQLTQTNRKGGIYKHPHQGEKATGTDNEGHFYDRSLLVRQYDSLHVQLTCHTIKGVMSPDIQLLKLTSQVNICLEHQKYPCDCFATTARHNASRVRYGSIEEYTKAWIPVLAMEAATDAVAENDSFTIAKFGVRWVIDEGKTVGRATLPVAYCTSRQLEVFPGDLICIRVRYEDCESRCPKGDSETNSAAGENVPVVDASVKHPESRKLTRDEAKEDTQHTSNPTDFWVGHCVLEKCNENKEKSQQTLEFRLHQTSSDVPQGLYDGRTHISTFEMIHLTLPQRRMYAALCLVPDASDLVIAICKGQEPKKGENFGKPPLQLSLSRHYPKSKFKELNSYQEKAVKDALANPLSLIQGPPGTGKTVTGVHIAHWFAWRNKALRPTDMAPDEDEEMENVPKAPPQVLYCGPSNKSVDVVAEYLLRETDLKILRVCSALCEQNEFPIPNKLKPVRQTRSADEMVIQSSAVLDVCLHRVIRAPGSPFAEELKNMEEMFREDKLKRERTSDECVREYRKLILNAETWAIQETGVQIILCTCAVAGSPRIEMACDNLMQCIVDECGMCMEPETLIPMTCKNIKQIVLIGDHKQLQPVIKDNVAKNLGLQVSMFERLSKWATMLQRQYRMHEAICDFPSQQFYDGKLETDRSVKSRGPDGVDWWPARQLQQKDRPVVFCHVEGKEESTVFKTAQSNEQSKSNMKEVNKVVHLAKFLVNKYSIDKKNIVILSPYRDQRSKITDKLKGAYEEIEVTTFTKSQGSEWDYVILSLVRSLPEHEIDPDPSTHWLREKLGFITDHHQINVALTRARRGMCIIGNKNLLRMDSMWGALLDHYEQHECVVDESWPGWT